MDAFAEFPTHKILEACVRFSEARDVAIAEKVEPIIRAVMAPRWFRSGCTREEAIAYLEACSDSHPYKYFKLRMWDNHYSIVNGVGWLAHLAEQNNVQTVQLSNAAAVALAPYLKASYGQP